MERRKKRPQQGHWEHNGWWLGSENGSPRLHLCRSRRKLSPRLFCASNEQRQMLLLPGPIECNMTQTESANGDDCRPHTLPTNKRTGDKTMRLQIAACLLCLMIVVGTVDSLPDPPAVQPQRSQNNLVSQRDYHVDVAAENHASDCLTCAPLIQASLFSFGQIFEGRGPSYDPTFVRQATDTSPPCFS